MKRGRKKKEPKLNMTLSELFLEIGVYVNEKSHYLIASRNLAPYAYFGPEAYKTHRSHLTRRTRIICGLLGYMYFTPSLLIVPVSTKKDVERAKAALDMIWKDYPYFIAKTKDSMISCFHTYYSLEEIKKNMDEGRKLAACLGNNKKSDHMYALKFL